MRALTYNLVAIVINAAIVTVSVAPRMTGPWSSSGTPLSAPLVDAMLEVARKMSGLTQRVERGTIAQCCPSEQSVEDVFDNWAIFSTTSQVHSEVLEPNCCYV